MYGWRLMNTLSIHSKAVKKLGLIRKSRQFLDQSTALMLYQILLLPQINYCDIVYDTTSMADKNKLQIVQNCALRTILNCDKFTLIDYMHNKLKILTHSRRRKLHTAVEWYKNVNKPENSLHYMFKKKPNRRRTKASDTDVIVPNYHTLISWSESSDP